MDEFLEQLSYTQDHHGRYDRGCEHKANNNHDECYLVLLSELTNFLFESTQQTQQFGQPVNKKPKSAASDASITLSVCEAEQLLRDTSAILSDTRPPPNFVVYKSNSSSTSDSTNQPPLFDGSVANATPVGPHGGNGIAAAGAGTILHLACALDVPLCLAFVLSMGADARACHTAFRRLMIHEAACNGSIQCLQLLLEFGEHCDSSLCFDPIPRKLNSPDSSINFPLFQSPRIRNERMGGRNLERFDPVSSSLRHNNILYKRSKSPIGPPAIDQSHFMLENETYKQLGFLKALRMFRDISKQVQAGTLSELDAARKVLFHPHKIERSQSRIRDSDQFSLELSSFDSFHPSRNDSLWMTNGINNRSDGHGNTPLHWASFKNETECVKLLLKYKADPNAKASPSGWTPLHDAAYSNAHESILLLLQSGADVDSRAASGATPLCFAAQEDAAEAAGLLLEYGAELTIRCSAGRSGDDDRQPGANAVSRFSGYSPLHYCAHYNAKNAVKILLKHPDARMAMEITDFQERLPIHVAVARGSSDVLRELLHAGARVETRISKSPTMNTMNESINSVRSSESNSSSRSIIHRRRSTSHGEVPVGAPLSPSHPNTSRRLFARVVPPSPEAPATPLRRRTRVRSDSLLSDDGEPQDDDLPSSPPVSSPLLRSMIPSQPVTSSKPWNCLSQRSIDECRSLISEVEQNWTPNRHSLFTPADRRAVAALLLVGKRMESENGIFFDVWPEILSFCPRGWFEQDDVDSEDDDSAIDESDSNDIIDEVLEARRDSNNADRADLTLPTFC